MLQEFMIGIYGGQNQISVDNFEYAMVMMGDYKNKYKNELRFPKGIRYNWFPLVLLHRYKQISNDINSTELSQIRTFFKKCYNNPKYFSFYLDRYERQGNSIAVYYRATESMSNEIKSILKIYGLDCKEYSKVG